jgi:integrase
MASIGQDRNGRKRILFVAQDGTRKTIRLGKASVKQAEAFKVKIEALVTAGITGSMDDETARWVATRGQEMHDKLSAVGLATARESQRLGDFLDAYIAERVDVKPGTATVYGHTKRNLIEFFGAETLLRDINSGQADQWRLYLLGEGLSENTTRRRSGIAKQFFRAALKRKLVTSNPFADLKAAILANPKKMYFLSLADTQRVLDACPDAQWRLIVALSRFGGLRCPSEHLALRWVDVDWDKSKMLVHSSKTEHHVGGESRWVPIFPELMPHLRAVFEQAAPSAAYVITRYRSAEQNLRTQFERIIKRAGLKQWPKLFQNLRSTRETELADIYPEHVVTRWIGHTSAVARKHYLQVTDAHFEQAAKGQQKGGTESGTQAAQFEAQHEAGQGSTNQQKPLFQADIADRYGKMLPRAVDLVGDKGFEPLTPSV